MRSVRLSVLVAGAATGLACIAGTAQAQNGSPIGTANGAAVASSGIPQRDTLIRLTRRLSVDFNQHRLEDVVRFISEYTGAQIEALWVDDQFAEGLDKEQAITLSVKNISALALIERVMEKAQIDEENSWQMASSGEIQIGPKTRLNVYKRVEIYDINDLLLELPDFPDVPEIDLQQALQQSGGGGGGGGGGQSPFEDNEDENQNDRKPLEDRAQEVVDIIQEFVETEQWFDNGGEGGTIKHWRGTLIIKAPDYMHRQLVGYPYWPRGRQVSTAANGRRYVSLNMETGVSKVDGFAQQEVSAVVGGQIFRSNDPPGGGG
jgi:hypothetical protein